MQLDYNLLEALAAVIREGKFEAAARSLNLTQSAISQRIKLLEQRAGAVLVVRGRPCVATEYGQQLCRHLDQVRLLEHDLRRNLMRIQEPLSEAPAVMRVAVNRDSLATWFPEVVRRAGSELNLHLEVVPDDQEYTAERLRNGDALAAITTEANPIPGCRRFSLGDMEYPAVAAKDYMEVHFPDGVTLDAVSRSAHLVFDEKDLLPQQWVINAFGTTAVLFGHRIPCFSGYMCCCLNGSGWGMMPRGSVQHYLDSGALVELVPGAVVVVPLFWQAAAPSSEIMRILLSMVRDTAGKYLLPPSFGPSGAS